jgi:hypothetical protein
MHKKLALFLFSPDKFFEGKSRKEISLKISFFIILGWATVVGLGGAIIAQKIMLPSQGITKELELYSRLGTIIGILSSSLGSFGGWFLLSGIFFTISHFLEGKGEFKRTAEFVAWGIIPLIFSGIIGCFVSYYRLSPIQIPSLEIMQSNPNLIKEMLAANPLMKLLSIIGIIFMLWSANLWIFGLKHARNLTTKNAIITVLIPVAAMVLYSLHTGGML